MLEKMVTFFGAKTIVTLSNSSKDRSAAVGTLSN
jgi:hypothetical protein